MGTSPHTCGRAFWKALQKRIRSESLGILCTYRIDNVNMNGNLSDFESPSQILPRFTRTGNTFSENSPSASWITTGRSPAYYGHIHNMNDLPFADPCGRLFCNLSENILPTRSRDNRRATRCCGASNSS